MSIENIESGRSYSKYLSSFCINPFVTFETQDPEEKVILLLRKHPITFFSKAVGIVTFFFIPLFINIILGNILQTSEIIVVNILWYGFVFLVSLLNLLSYMFNVGIVTNMRIIDVDYHSIFNKEVSMSSLSEVTDVTGTSNGYLQSIFNYGDVFVQTAGITQNIEFLKIPDPSLAVSIINKLKK